jgi:hypothetical protein
MVYYIVPIMLQTRVDLKEHDFLNRRLINRMKNEKYQNVAEEEKKIDTPNLPINIYCI